MSYIALYREWRPLVFEDVVEQEHVVRTLRYSVSSGRIAHAYLFCGTRGTGKTTMAHILSRAINCVNPNNGDPCNQCEICTEILSGSSMDVLEIDAASNNSVDNVREIRDEVIYAPSRAKFKVYIIDEIHMLSSGAFNALLKTLEEPPAHVVFILATTEPQKLPATILSRCQRFDFRRITIDSISKRLNEIAASNTIKLENDAARLIAKMSDGALRDAISLLDQCISLGSNTISYNDVLSVVGIVKDTFITGMVDDMIKKDIGGILNKVNKLIMDGKDIHYFISDLILYFRNLLICKVTSGSSEVMEVPADVLKVMDEQTGFIPLDEIINIIKELSALESNLKWTTNPRVMLEVTLVKLCKNCIAKVDESIPSTTPKPELTSPKSNPKTEFVEKWTDVLEYLKSLGRRTVHSFLIDSKAVNLENDYIGILFDSKNQFAKPVIAKAENIQLIEEAAIKVLGRQVKIRCIDVESINSKLAKVKVEEKDEFVEKARSLAERLGVPLEIIDE